MKQLIDKSALVAEINGLKSAAETMLTGKTDLSYWKAQKFISERLLSFIDTLEVKEVDLDCNITGIKTKHAEGKLKECIESITEESLSNARKQLQKEPVSEELEKAALLYYPKMSMISEPHGLIPADNKSHYLGDANEDNRKAFKVGAKWQEEQFENERLKHCDALTEEQAQIESDFVAQHIQENKRTPTFIDAIEYGMKLQKEQMMAKAIDGEVGYWNLHGLSVNVKLPSTIEEGDKVKVIVIKED